MTATYTMRGETYEFGPPTTAEEISRLVWLVNNGRGEWSGEAARVIKETRDAERVISLPNGQRWKVEGRKDAAGKTTWVAERLPDAAPAVPPSDSTILTKVRAGQDLTTSEIAYLRSVLDGTWHNLPLQG